MVNPLDVDELSGAIAELLGNPKKRELSAQKGLERSRLFREEQTAGKIYHHIIDLLESIR
jgi:glycosyltransferase involved in cell wall biosynthesis